MEKKFVTLFVKIPANRMLYKNDNELIHKMIISHSMKYYQPLKLSNGANAIYFYEYKILIQILCFEAIWPAVSHKKSDKIKWNSRVIVTFAESNGMKTEKLMPYQLRSIFLFYLVKFFYNYLLNFKATRKDKFFMNQQLCVLLFSHKFAPNIWKNCYLL